MYIYFFGIAVAITWFIAVNLTRKQINRRAEDLVFNLEYPEIQKKSAELEKEEKIKEADKVLRRGVKKYNHTFHAYINYYEFLIRHKRQEEASKLLMKLHRKTYSDRDIHDHAKGHLILRISEDFKRLGNLSAAEGALEKAVKDGLQFHLLWMRYADFARNRGDLKTCIVRLEAAQEMFPDLPEIHIQIAIDLYAAKQHAAADAVLEVAMAKFITRIEIFIRWARSAHERQDWPEAARRWAVLQERFVLNAECFEKGAESLRALGRDAEADAVMQDHPGMRAVPWPLQ